MTVYRYMIAFSYDAGPGIGFANIDITSPVPVRTMADVAAIADSVRKQGYHRPTVLAFSRFDDTTDADAGLAGVQFTNPPRSAP